MKIAEMTENLDYRKVVAVAVALLLLLGAGLFVFNGSSDTATATEAQGSDTVAESNGEPFIDPDPATGLIEVPDVGGETREVAESLLNARDLKMIAFGDEATVSSQTPVPGTEVEAGSQVIVRFGDLSESEAAAAGDAESAAGVEGNPLIDEGIVIDPDEATPLPDGLPDPSDNVATPNPNPNGPPPTAPENPDNGGGDKYTTGKFYVTWDPNVPTSVDQVQEFQLASETGTHIRTYPLRRGNGCQEFDLTFPAMQGHRQLVMSLNSKENGDILGTVSFTVSQAGQGFNGRVKLETGVTPLVKFNQDPTRLGC